jgi:predicted  nucleic acid-binding Zn-ribbon protein
MERIIHSESCEISNLPLHPRVLSDVDCSRITVTLSGSSSITEKVQTLTSEYENLRQLKPRVKDNFEALNMELSETEMQILSFENRIKEIWAGLTSLNEVIRRLDDDLEIVNSDIRNNNDAARLKNFGSEATGWDISTGVCPVCKQHIQDNLLTTEVASGFMSIEDNIRHLKEQKKMLEFTLGSRKDTHRKLQREKEDVESRLQTLGRLAQTLRSDLFTTTDTEASEAIMLKWIWITNRIERLSVLNTEITVMIEQMKGLSGEWNLYLDQKGKLPKNDISDLDITKIGLLKKHFISNLNRYHYSSLSSFDGIDISVDSSLLPTIDGFDMKFDSSASDGIRVIWALTMALLQVSIEQNGNHPGVIIFDEPAQQSIVPEVVKSFIDSVVELDKSCQIITAITLNSKELNDIIDGLKTEDYRNVVIEGKAFKLL